MPASPGRWWLLVLLGAQTACVEVPEFAEPWLIDRPRAIAVIAEPPEITPGQSSELSVVLVGGEAESVRWSACGIFDSNIGGMQYGEQDDREGCSGSDLSLPLGEGERVVLPGAVSAAVFDNLELASEILGGFFPPETIERVKSEVGLPLLVEATLQTEGGVERAVKRVLISESETPHDNPPAPHFRFGDVEVAADPDEPLRCRAEGGGAVQHAAGERVELAPVVDGEQEAWLESYQVIDSRGVQSERAEKAFYSWFVTGGSLSEGVTEAPLRNEVWSLPSGEARRNHRLFVVVRDGHGGTSACVLAVEVVQ